MQKGEVVTVLEECHQDGDARVRIGHDRWISRLTAKGSVLAQPMAQPSSPTMAMINNHPVMQPHQQSFGRMYEQQKAKVPCKLVVEFRKSGTLGLVLNRNGTTPLPVIDIVSGLAQEHEELKVGMTVVAVESAALGKQVDLRTTTYAEVQKMLRLAGRPMKISFAEPSAMEFKSVQAQIAQPQPMVQQVQQALVSVYEPPTISVAKAPATITEFLHKIRLTEFEAPLFELGASSIEDLADLTETDVQELGLKPLEVKRFMRAISELSYSKDE